MRKDKSKAFLLRKEGKTYRELETLLGISKSTLCIWFKNESWSKHIKNNNNTKNIHLSKERLLKLNQGRKNKLKSLYEKAEEEATLEFENLKHEPLFMAGLMIYAGEGDKISKSQIRISNSEFYINRIFIKFSEKYLDIKRDNIKIGLILYPDLDTQDCIQKWSTELGIQKSNFYKTQIIQGKEKIKRLQFGIGMTIILSTFLKKKIIKWLELCKEL